MVYFLFENNYQNGSILQKMPKVWARTWFFLDLYQVNFEYKRSFFHEILQCKRLRYQL